MAKSLYPHEQLFNFIDENIIAMMLLGVAVWITVLVVTLG